MCWEKLSAVFTSCINLGSPPRVRGKDAVCTVGDAGCRITPACAGKSASQGSRRCPQRDHPRVCGEKECLWHGLHYGWRITPACAGKRPSARTCRIASGDHPRVCGEKADGNRQRGFCEGSPPRVRGKGFPSIHIRRVDGITPACAGKRYAFPTAHAGNRDHPRVCGEKVCFSNCPRGKQGSPPRVRGKVGSSFRIHLRCRDHPRVCGEKPSTLQFIVEDGRITPACAGKRIHYSIQHHCALGSPPRVRGKEFTTASSTIVLWDHPRVCGEKAVLPMWTNTRLGSPPRVRGKAFSYSARSRAVGITPACAGKRPPDFPSRPPAGDHPRVCGEKAFNERRWDLVLGSPPRVRGKVGSGVDLGPHLGITPACAGKSQ